MAQNTLTHRGTMAGYVDNGPEMRGDAGSPRAASAAVGAQLRTPFVPPAAPLGGGHPFQQERPELPEAESSQEPGRDPWTYSVRVDEPSFAGAIQGRSGELADQISGTAPRAIESTAPKVIAGIAEDVL